MKKVLLIAIPVGIVLLYFSQVRGASQDYVQEIEDYWEDRHDFFTNSTASPFVQRETSYEDVDYYPPNPNYRVNGKLERYTTREIVSIGNSDGTVTNYLKFAQANFKIDGEQQTLLILKTLGFGNQYFTAFGDETSGETTYGGGRYLDLVIGKSDQVSIDFNKAYNPYCAYFDDYSCPLPPKENLLTVRIEAGEKVYPH